MIDQVVQVGGRNFSAITQFDIIQIKFAVLGRSDNRYLVQFIILDIKKGKIFARQVNRLLALQFQFASAAGRRVIQASYRNGGGVWRRRGAVRHVIGHGDVDALPIVQCVQ